MAKKKKKKQFNEFKNGTLVRKLRVQISRYEDRVMSSDGRVLFVFRDATEEEINEVIHRLNATICE